jgi:hypothetical protein
VKKQSMRKEFESASSRVKVAVGDNREYDQCNQIGRTNSPETPPKELPGRKLSTPQKRIVNAEATYYEEQRDADPAQRHQIKKRRTKAR